MEMIVINFIIPVNIFTWINLTESKNNNGFNDLILKVIDDYFIKGYKKQINIQENSIKRKFFSRS